MALLRMDNVGIVVESLDTAIAFFTELGMQLEGRTTIEGAWAGRVTGLGLQRVEIAMLVTPDGHSRIELSRFLTPPAVSDHRNAPVNALGYLRVMFAVDDLDAVLARLRTRGAVRAGAPARPPGSGVWSSADRWRSPASSPPSGQTGARAPGSR